MRHPGMSVADQILDLTHCPLCIVGGHPDRWQAWIDEGGRGAGDPDAHRLTAKGSSLDEVLTKLLAMCERDPQS